MTNVSTKTYYRRPPMVGDEVRVTLASKQNDKGIAKMLPAREIKKTIRAIYNITQQKVLLSNGDVFFIKDKGHGWITVK